MSETLASHPKVAFLIVNFNGLRFLEDCFNSIKNSMKCFTYEVIVVDNASSDGSQSYLRGRKDITYIESEENLGFTGGNNLAASFSKAEVLILLNNDTVIKEKIESLVLLLDSQEVGVVGPKLIYGDGRQQNSVGLRHQPVRLIMSWLGLERYHRLPSIFRRTQTAPTYYNKSHENVDWVSGACMATPRKLWNELGGMDEAFFMYCEDVDYCERVKNAGYRVAYHHEAVVMHYEGAGKAWIGLNALQRTANSYAIYLKKHYSTNVSKITCVGISVVFLIRSIAFRCIEFLPKQSVEKRLIWAEKKFAYFNVASFLFEKIFSQEKHSGEI